MNIDLNQIGLDAVDRFITTWNSRNAADWADSLKYPHVRPAAAGATIVAQDREQYIAGVDFEKVIATGWDHSEWDYRQVLHTSASKIHVAGQWSRYNPEGQVILSTPIVYIVTLVDGSWGIQSRFAADYVDEETDTTEMQTRGMNLVQDFVNHQNVGNLEACVELLNFPHFSVSGGDLGETADKHAFTLLETSLQTESMMAIQTGQHAINIAVEFVLSDGSKRQAVVHVNDRDQHLGIQAWSSLDPNELAA